mgnify:CR=1 FL=1
MEINKQRLMELAGLSELQTGDNIGGSAFDPGKVDFDKIDRLAEQLHSGRHETLRGSGKHDSNKHKYFEITSATEKVNGKPKIYCFQLAKDVQMHNVVRLSIATPDSGAGSFPHNMGMYVVKAAEDIYNRRTGKMDDSDSLSEEEAIKFIKELK